MQQLQLEQQVSDLLKNPQGQSNQLPSYWMNPETNMMIPVSSHPGQYQNLFGEPQNNFSMPSMSGLLTVQKSNLMIVVLGAIMAGAVGGIINRFMPLGNFGTVLGGLLLMHLTKKKGGFLKDFAQGVLIGGAVSLLSGTVTGMLGGMGGLFGQPAQNKNVKTQAPVGVMGRGVRY